MRKFSLTLNRFVALLLVFILGFLTCIGSIIGAGYFAYTRVSLEFLEKLGIISINEEDYINTNAEVSLSTMTLQGLVAEIQSLASLDEDLSLDILLNRYGLTLSKEADALIPEGIKTVSFKKLLSEDGINYVLDNTKVNYIFNFVPEGVISEPAKAVLADKTFGDVVRLNLGHLLNDVKLGYLTGVDYVIDADGEYNVVYKDAQNPTLFELMAPLQVDEVLRTFVNGGDLFKIIENDLGDVMVKSFIDSFIDLEAMDFPNIFADKLVSDLIEFNEETGNYALNIMNVFKGSTVAEIMQYEPIVTNGITVGYIDKEGQEVVGLMRGLGGVALDFLAEGDYSITTFIEDVYLGDMLEFTPVFDYDTGEIISWNNEDGDAVTGLNEAIANIALGKLLNDPDYNVTSVLDNVMLGDVMGNTPVYDDDGKLIGWQDESSKDLEGIDKAVANIDIGRLVNDPDYKIEDMFNDLYIGEIMGYHFHCVKCSDPNTDNWCDECKSNLESDGSPECTGCCESGIWLDKDNKEADGVLSCFVNLTVDDMCDNAKVSAAIQSVKISDAMGYKYETRCPIHNEAPDSCTSETCDEGVYGLYDSDGKLVKGFMVSIADKHVSEMDGIMDEITVAEVMGYTYDPATDAYYEGEIIPDNRIIGVMGAVCGYTVSELDSRLGNLYIGDVMDFYFHCEHCQSENTDSWCDECKANVNADGISECKGNCEGGYWYKDKEHTQKATGVMSAFARLTINEMKQDSKITEAMRMVSIGEAMGYQRHCSHCDKISIASASCTCDSCTVTDCPTDWYDNSTNPPKKVSGIMKTIVNSDIGHLSNQLDETYIGDILAYRYDDPDTASTSDDPNLDGDDDGWWYNDEETDPTKAKTSPLINRLSSSKIKDLSDTLNDLTIVDIFTEEDMSSGFLSLLKPGPGEEAMKLTELGTQINHIFENTTMIEYHNAGLIIDEDMEIKLNTIKAAQESLGNEFNWETMNLNEFVSSIASLIS